MLSNIHFEQSKDGSAFTIGNVDYIYIGCDITGLDLLKYKSRTDKKQAIISTCRVTEQYRQKCIDVIKQYKQDNPTTELFITGCDALFNPQTYTSYGKVVSHQELQELFTIDLTQTQLSLKETDRLYNIVEIQRGCNHRCAYCLFPQTQGPSSCRKASDILAECKRLDDLEVDTIELASTDCCSYRDGSITYSTLIKQILAECTHVKHFNIGALDPASDEVFHILELQVSDKRLPSKVHLAVQSGSDSVLARMRRRHNVARLRQIHKQKTAVRYAWDLIIGFPGETEEEFEETFNLMEELKPEQVFAYPYQSQPNTDAAAMPNQVSKDICTKRVKRIRDLEAKIQDYYRNADKAINKVANFNRYSDNRLIQYELWLDCNQHCPFCYNRHQPNTIDKLGLLNRVKDRIHSPEVKKFNSIGIIGGEIFDPDIFTSKDVLDSFLDLCDLCIETLIENNMRTFYMATNLLYEDTSILYQVLDRANKRNVISNLCICTSWDTKYRFKSKEQELLWEKNMLDLHKAYPTLSLHVETILTQWYIDSVLSGAFDIKKFCSKFNTHIDYMVPNCGYDYASKKAFEQDMPGFFPKRASFLRFLNKGIADGTINLRDFLARDLQCDTIYLLKRTELGEDMKIENRMSTPTQLPCDQCKLVGYIDSDILINDDVIRVKEELLD